MTNTNLDNVFSAALDGLSEEKYHAMRAAQTVRHDVENLMLRYRRVNPSPHVWDLHRYQDMFHTGPVETVRRIIHDTERTSKIHDARDRGVIDTAWEFVMLRNPQCFDYADICKAIDNLHHAIEA
jgi:hypothetical protein